MIELLTELDRYDCRLECRPVIIRGTVRYDFVVYENEEGHEICGGTTISTGFLELEDLATDLLGAFRERAEEWGLEPV